MTTDSKLMTDEQRQRRDRTFGVLDEVLAERERQFAKHGDQAHLPDGTGPLVQWIPSNWSPTHRAADYYRARCQMHSQNEGGDGSITFLDIFLEEVAEALAEDDPVKLRAEIIQVVAVGVQWAEAIDRRAARTGTPDCVLCGRDDDHGTHEALERSGHLDHPYTYPEAREVSS